MQIEFSTISHSIGAASYILLAIYIANKHLRRQSDRSLLVAAIATIIWLTAMMGQSLDFNIPYYIRYTLELIRNAAWFDVLYAMLGISFFPKRELGKDRFYLTSSILLLLSLMLSITLFQGVTGKLLISTQLLLILQLSISIVGILLLEQVWRNGNSFRRNSIKYFTIAIASIFAYDFFMYTDALLFKELSKPAGEVRGIINALVVPLITLSIIQSNKQASQINVSRQMVFHSATLTLAGIYLIFISVGGYYISFFGGTWGEALRVLFISSGLIVLVLLTTSPILRAKIMVFISKNFFTYKYDYRDEWIKSTNALASREQDQSLYFQIAHILSDLVGSRSSAIWCKDDDGLFTLRSQQGAIEGKLGSIDNSSDLVIFFKQHDWIINLDEYMMDPSKYHLIEIPEDILHEVHPWLIIPLGSGDHISGLVLLCDPIADIDLNWENYDLLKIVSQQACSYVDQRASQEKLGTAKQFEAVNKASAFLVHDIKTIIAQLSLLVKNAEKHKTNPAFIDDMIRTTSHTVDKMGHLLHQIRNPNQSNEFQKVDLRKLLLDIYLNHKKSSPSPSLEASDNFIWINADKEELRSAIGHIIQNAIEATHKDGAVSISTKAGNKFIYIFIQDTGSGMSEDYIEHHLFKPFDSTKGLTGMGIGVYQSREYLRKINGTINVTSELGFGTCFTLKLPIVDETLVS
ncbi:MAG: putative PEP-CTERM system histidine kinase [Oleiphilaceae bacterium]|jgi:putative PEP-CTERM system histidine kinase